MLSVLKQISAQTWLFWLAAATATASMISIAACHSLLGITLGVIIARRGVDLRWPPYWPALAAFFVCTIASAAASGHFCEGWPQLRKFYVWLILLVVYAGVRSARESRIVLTGMVAGASASALWGMVQFYLKYQRAMSAGEPFYRSYVASRITGFTSHWMTFASDMMLALLTVAALLLFARRSLTRLQQWAAGGVLALLGLALLLSFVRSAWPATAAGLMLLLWYWRRAAVLSLPLLAGMVVAVAPEPLHSRIESIWKPNAQLDSNEHRAVLRRTGIAMAADNPLLGVGPERVYARFADYYPADAPHPVPVEWYYKHLHNTYIHYAAERGIPAAAALVAFVLLNWGWLLRALRGAVEPDQRLALLIAAAAVPAILVGGWWEVNLGDSEVLGGFLSVLGCGLAEAPEERPRPA
ncbi:MAG: O-antigen ligase family protein [Acidobacteria bacterium]|nr:O-antigen ligase family protein [Acidobacteriota bacterium]